MSDTILYDEAVKMLPDKDEIHTFRNSAGMLIGCDWHRDEILKALKDAKEIFLTSGYALRFNYGLAINDHGILFIETKPCEQDAA